MPTITITFEHQQAETPKYTFGERVVVTDECAPKNWLTGEIVGLTLETEIYSPRWWYSIKLDALQGLTEEYLEDDVIPAIEIAVLQAESERLEANWTQEDDHNPLPKFQPGMQVKFTFESGCNLPGDFGEVVESKYVSSKGWSGWVYKLTNKNLTEPIEIGEIWLELAPTNTEAKYKSSISK